MRLSSSRALVDMKPVLLDPAAAGPDPVYQVFTDLNDHFWVNKTVITPGRMGKEYSKTFGHYHGVDVFEKYFVAEGKGVLQLQKKHIEGETWLTEMVNEVLLVKAEPGDEIIVTAPYGHSWSNVGDKELVLFDNWSIPHEPTDYDAIKKLHGLAYYLTEEGREIKAVTNPNYKNLPQPTWLTAEELVNRA